MDHFRTSAPGVAISIPLRAFKGGGIGYKVGGPSVGSGTGIGVNTECDTLINSIMTGVLVNVMRLRQKEILLAGV